MRVVVADSPREFAWENMGGPDSPATLKGERLAHWSYRFTPVDGVTHRVDESWRILNLSSTRGCRGGRAREPVQEPPRRYSPHARRAQGSGRGLSHI